MSISKVVPDIPIRLNQQILSSATPRMLSDLQSCVKRQGRGRQRSATRDHVGQLQYQQVHSDKHHCQHHQPQSERSRQPTLSSNEVAYIFREPFLLTGYRVPYKDWWYYMNSMFHIHNESFNVWTHCIAFFVFIHKLYWWLSHLDDPFNEPLLWPLLGFSLGTLAYSSLSTVAHLFQSKSELAHYTFFQLDYIGIGMNATGSALLTFYFFGGDSFYELLGYNGCVIYQVGNFVFGFLVCTSCALAKLYYLRPYTFVQMFLKLGVCGIHIIYGFMPLFFLLYDRLFAAGSDSSGDVTVHVYYMIPFFIAVFFYASHLPERLDPGRFDLIGYGHGLFHIAMVMTSLFQYDAAWFEVQSRRRELHHTIVNQTYNRSSADLQFPQPSCQLIVGEFVTLITACILFVTFTHPVRLQRVYDITTSTPATPATPRVNKTNHKTINSGYKNLLSNSCTKTD